ncbi:hypothetical protein RSOLAG1IB_11090 [Rhizoctonia solani AG-1 IB]|uniref:NACHT domain-containing protein n=1 Tax=Thanatephorus cucumeris (strain AG1-IB / isolate 7/3/14) TaxID=1108050 RepID=A0A0B7F3V5_THACB|nr:hypothetical protein RSOLAG1IB_11090 [Rhizoctonia solani AG-1 IB]
MPYTMSLRDSLSRSREKWKRRLHVGSSDTSHPSSAPDSIPDSAPPHELIGQAPNVHTLVQNSSRTSDSHTSTGSDNTSEKTGDAWSLVKSLLSTLESTADAFGPLKAAVSGLGTCVKICETSSAESKEYDELRLKLENILEDLATHTKQPSEPAMTTSVKRIYSDLEEEVKKVTEKQTRTTGRRLIDATKEHDEIIKCYRRIDGHLQRLAVNANVSLTKMVNKQAMELQLASMSPSRSAMYNSAESCDIKRGVCAPGTRKAQIDQLLEWAHDPETGQTCWMNGMAGTGKTTIAYSVCERLDEAYELGASFFCSRTMPECRQVKYIIPTIAYQLARFSVPFRNALYAALESDPDAHARTPKLQYEKLVVGPLSEVRESLPANFIVVIDALDECESEDAAGEILDLLLSTTYGLPIRYLVSSRPEREITHRMAKRENREDDVRLVLHDLDTDEVRMDIEVYMRHQLRHIPLTDPQWMAVIKRCGVLFIYASTTCRYITQAYEAES